MGSCSPELAPPGDKVAVGDPALTYLMMVSDGEDTQAVVARGLRSAIQPHQKVTSAIRSQRDRCQKGSGRWRKLTASIAREYQRRRNLQHNLLHHAANHIVNWCVERAVGTLVVCDITELPRGKRGKRSRRLNQPMSHPPLGQFYQYLDYKLDRVGALFKKQSDAYASQQCTACGYRNKPGDSTTMKSGSSTTCARPGTAE